MGFVKHSPVNFASGENDAARFAQRDEFIHRNRSFRHICSVLFLVSFGLSYHVRFNLSSVRAGRLTSVAHAEQKVARYLKIFTKRYDRQRVGNALPVFPKGDRGLA